MRPSFRRPHRQPAAIIALLIASLPSYMGCTCSDDHPYTPFEVATSLASGGTSSEGAAEPKETPPEPQVAIAVAARGQTSWRVFDRTVEAPPGFSFERAFLFGKEAPLPLFWLVPQVADGKTGRAGLYQSTEDGALRSVFTIPHFLPEGPDCATAFEPAPSGKSTVVIALRTTCQTERLAGTPMAALVFVDAKAKVPDFGVRLLASAPGEELRVTGDASDQDGDGADDRAVHLELVSPKKISAKAGFRWLSRPAGPSRRTESPGQEFTERAERLAISAIRKKERERVPSEVDALRRLFGAVCAESTTGRVALLDGAPLRCGLLDRALASLTHSSITARLGLGEASAALGEFERADWYGAGPDERQSLALRKLFAEKIPAQNSDVTATIELPKESDSWLSWDRSGRLWIHDGDGESPIWPQENEKISEGEHVAPGPGDAAAPRPKTPDPRVGPGGRRLIRVLPSCDRSEIQIVLHAPQETTPAQPLPILAPRPAACDQFGRPPLRGRVVQFRGAEADLLIEGEPISERGGSFTPRSPIAWHTRLGLAIFDQTGMSLWKTGREARELNCAVDEQRTRAACAHGKTIAVYTKTIAGAPAPERRP